MENAFTPEAAATIYEDLKEVVSNPEGTGHSAAQVAGVALAGKQELQKSRNPRRIKTEQNWAGSLCITQKVWTVKLC